MTIELEQTGKLKIMNHNNKQYYRVYDEKLDLVYETSTRQKELPQELKGYLNRSKLFVSIDNIKCYRMIPK